MKINSVQSSDFMLSHKGGFLKDNAFKRFEKSLNESEKDKFEKIIVSIENAADENKWWFDTTSFHNGKLKVAVIGRLNKDGTPKRPGYFLDEEKNALDLFKKLSNWYKNNIKGYKG